MEKFHLNHSLKNIPLHGKLQYQRTLVNKTEKFLNNVRWKLFAKKYPEKFKNKETFGFNTTAQAPFLPELKKFEDDVFTLIRSIKFRNVTNDFQNDLKYNIGKIKSSDEIFVTADKTKNIYKIPVEKYQQILNNNVTKDYEKTSLENVSRINKEASTIASELKVADRVNQHTRANAFITIKDHKENFPQKLECRLINPAKSNIGRISKVFSENAVKEIKSKTALNQWKNSHDVIKWFQNLEDKKNLTFLKFDIVSFYPSISKELLIETISWAKQYHKFTKEEEEVILNARKTFLFHNNTPWVKKGNKDFDVTMGAFDGAEICELVGLYILHRLENFIDREHVGLYRDDGLAVLKGSGPQIERKRKQIFGMFKNLGLQITSIGNIKKTDFLDLQLDLEKNQFRPYHKTNQIPEYVNIKSNHPPMIIKEIPKIIERRVSTLSASENVFNEEKPFYEKALANAGYKNKLEYNDSTPETKEKRKRSRKVTWFNPPFSASVKTNIAAKFLQLIDKHFKNTPLSKIFNRSTIKVSYSCLPNIQQIISSHNKTIIAKHESTNQTKQKKLCNCNKPKDCPLKGKCLKSSLVYKAEVATVDKTMYYYGHTIKTFKERFRNHVSSFKNSQYELSTSLSKYIWKLKNENKNFEISWNIVGEAKKYSPETKICNICNLEKTLIITEKEEKLLNKRHELLNKCRHREEYLLSNI